MNSKKLKHLAAILAVAGSLGAAQAEVLTYQCLFDSRVEVDVQTGEAYRLHDRQSSGQSEEPSYDVFDYDTEKNAIVSAPWRFAQIEERAVKCDKDGRSLACSMEHAEKGPGHAISFEIDLETMRAEAHNTMSAMLQVHFTSGKCNLKEIRSTFYESGRLRSTAVYVDGKKHGPLVLLAEDGRMISETHFQDDVPHGPFLLANADASRALRRGAHKHGKLDGAVKDYYPTGEPRATTLYSEGVIVDVQRSYHINGTVLAEIPYSDGKINGTVKTYRPDGTLEREIEVVDDVCVKGYAVAADGARRPLQEDELSF